MSDAVPHSASPPRPTATIRSADASTTGFIVVRLAKAYPPHPNETLIDLAHENPELRDLEQYLRDRNATESTRSVIGVPPTRILEWERSAGHVDGLAPLRSLLQYWRVDTRNATDGTLRINMIEMAAQLARKPGVDTAYVEYDAIPAAVDPSNDPLSGEQTYLGPPVDPAHPTKPGGIDARNLWAMGFDGSGINFVDIERGWFLDHLDLVSRSVKTIAGDKQETSNMSHGTAVLGIVTAADNDTGVVGIAPNIASVTVASVLRTNKVGLFHADTIATSIDLTVPGDVILLELQNNHSGDQYPAEVDDAVFDAIRLASALGRVVVEAAANGKMEKTGIDLDTYLDSFGRPVLKRGERDSGAILVGASVGAPPYTPADYSNYGSRIDCFAPGEGLTTCRYDDGETGDDQSTYEPTFGGTSGASAVIAGAALLVQNFWKVRTGNVLSPTAIRSLLSDRTINWPQGPSTHCIGVMPNLGEIALAVLPDIYLRDTIVDDGVIPSTGMLSTSPDIIVRGGPVPSPNASFGEGSGTEQNVSLSDPVRVGADHYLHARLRNRGSATAVGASVTFYWSAPSTLVTPDQWHLIGTTPAFDVPTGDMLAVSDAVTWPAANNPGLGHYCFIAVASHPKDLAPPIPVGSLQLDWDAFLALVANNNNVAWRNFNIVNLAAPLAARKKGRSHQPPAALLFVLAGATDRDRVFTIDITARSIPSAGVKLIVPTVIAERLSDSLAGHTRAPVAQDGFAMLNLKPRAGLRTHRLIVERGARYPCAIVLEPPFSVSHGHPTVVVRQRYKGVEVGRITWAIRGADA